MRSNGAGRRRLWVVAGSLLAAVAVLAGGCSSPSSSAGAQERTVQVDYRHDEFASSLLSYYPRRVEVRPGDAVEFKQAWTGEPHSVTMGTLVDEKIRPVVRLLDQVRRTKRLPATEGEPPEFVAFGEALPFALTEEGTMAQNAAQPCYVDAADFEGTYPGDEQTPCPRRAQPAFDGTQAIFNSGVIPFEGVKGNTFRVQLADDLKPGTYNFYCNVHGPLQYGQLVVKQKGADVPSESAVARQARREAERESAPMLRNYEAARGGRPVQAGEQGEMRVQTAGLKLIGVPTPFFQDGQFVHGIVNEFVPRRVEAKVGQKVTWTFAGFHTLSFNVPRYFPVFTVEEDGTVVFNPRARDPVGWPGRPGGDEGPAPPEGQAPDAHAPPEGPAPPEGQAPAEGQAPPEGEQGEPEPVHVDAGEWDGRGFRSTGLSYQEQDTFSVTFTRPGTYGLACLIHPQMVGQVVVDT